MQDAGMFQIGASHRKARHIELAQQSLESLAAHSPPEWRRSGYI